MTKWKKYWNNNVVAKYFAIVVVGLCAGLALSGVLHVLMNNAQVRQQVEQQIATHPQNVQQTTRRSNERHVAQRAAARPLVRARQQVADTQSRNSRPVSQWIGKWFHVYNYDDLFLRVLNKLGVFVLLFSRPWCPGCRIVEKYFNDHNNPNVNYIYVDIRVFEQSHGTWEDDDINTAKIIKALLLEGDRFIGIRYPYCLVGQVNNDYWTGYVSALGYSDCISKISSFISRNVR